MICKFNFTDAILNIKIRDAHCAHLESSDEHSKCLMCMSLLRPLRQCFASVTLMVAFGIRGGLKQKFIQGSELLVEGWRDVSTIKGWVYNQNY